jgi:hypothetical protein
VTDSSISNALTNGSYGVHMAASMGIGFLFLGGSSYTFDTSCTSIAALLISMWPAFPSGPSDNRCHLQVQLHTSSSLLSSCLLIWSCCHPVLLLLVNANVIPCDLQTVQVVALDKCDFSSA